MQLGALLPLGDIGGDPATVREYAQAAESIGYDFIEAPDHVLGASEASAPEPGRTGAGLYHDPFVLFGYLAGCTSKLGFSTDRKSTRLNSSHLGISYAVFCLKKKTKTEQ